MWRSVVGAGLFVVPVTVTFTERVASVSQVIGISMQPLLNPAYLYNRGKTDWVLQNKLALSFEGIRKGDIVTFITPYDPRQMAVKRIIGMEGDLVRTRKDRDTSIIVPEGHVWVEGDNCRFSKDSNTYGPVSASLITSKATHVIWPPSRWQKLDSVEIETDRVVKYR